MKCIDFFVHIIIKLHRVDAPLLEDSNTVVYEHTCEMFSLYTAESTKDRIISSNTNPSGVVRVVIATIAFGLGLDAKNIRTIIHWDLLWTLKHAFKKLGDAGLIV